MYSCAAKDTITVKFSRLKIYQVLYTNYYLCGRGIVGPDEVVSQKVIIVQYQRVSDELEESYGGQYRNDEKLLLLPYMPNIQELVTSERDTDT